VSTRERVEEAKEQDDTLFQPADYGSGYGTLTSYPPSAAWTWLVYEEALSSAPTIIAYNDV